MLTIMSDAIADAYETYCRTQMAKVGGQQSVSSIRYLASSLRMEFPPTLAEYHALTNRLLEIWQESVGRTDINDSEDFKTAGTTRGVSRLYKFGPSPQLWVWAMWQLTRYPFDWRVVIKLQTVWEPNQRMTVAPHSEGLYQFVITCGIPCREWLGELLTVLRQFLGQFPAITLMAVPDSFLYFNQRLEFQEFVIENRGRVNLMSWNWESFYKKRWLIDNGVHFNDAMIDWATGLNFYTCRAGYQHTLPIFAEDADRRINLLNLMPPPDYWGSTKEDFFEPIAVIRCLCGQNRLEYRFVPHQSVAIKTTAGKFIYDTALAELLTSDFQSLQFIQAGKQVTIFCTYESENHDRDLLENYFAERGFAVQWKLNESYTIVGPKRLVFLNPPRDGIAP